MLDPGKTLEGQFAGGESHEYRFALDHGQYARINLFQRSINIAVECFGPDGKLRFQQDSHRIDDTEIAELIGDTTGTYRLRVTAPELHAPSGRYNITLAEVEPAVERHETRIAAARAYAQAGKLAKQTGRENLLKIIQSLELAAENWRTAHDLFEEARTLMITGLYYSQYGDRQRALDYETRAMVVAQASGNRRIEGWSYVDYALVVNFVGDKKKAIEYSDRGLPMLREAGDRAGEAAALDNLGRAYLQTGEGAKAIRYFEESLRIYEEIQDRHRGEGFDRAALVASEKARARSLLEMLGESDVEIRHGVDAALLARERQLEQLISAKAENQVRLLSREHTAADAAAAAKELDGLTTELEQVQGRIRQTNPQYTALMQPVPLDIKNIQAKVLDTDTVMMEYALGTKNSFLWVVTPSSVDVFELPSRSEIESTARHVYDLLTARNRKIENESPTARATRIRKADEAFGPAATKASAMLLGPSASRIAGKRLLIVAGGVLQYLPFASLPEPDNSAVPLMVNHEVITAPSASVIAILRQESAGRKPSDKAVAILADPVFSAGDARIVTREARRSADDLGGQQFVRLRFSRTEAEEIARLAAPGATLKALDFDASRDTALKPELGQYRILHFATHSLLNNEHPELSGVVLSLVDRDGRPQNGFLRLYDIYNLRLTSELVVLSACQTALGGEIKGEGLIGLTRGFLYAGAPRVVATLWEIDDRTTAELMKRFYEGVLGRGERPAAALRSAQIAMWKNRGWDAPYYWAAFTIQGEWR